ncbi:uncharacterized protein A1O5_04157 [Cladophialophora psammophila CBS 110553]|uniref:G-protein coupled receptors family 2 profile 2 domain-containing protein n=1 Tax=Cladophialophora psammophila CBS 110553 TaxID=1182543 RepID=W9WYI5_9EURO|nr:uncharacterized protein A1O5_04157 [Cladophialophora psammophila CBS 110553]EXJ73008.1 hypothetical protein A1O5_04157 [Cladophialophora psammophila CBS 110553]
MSEYNQTFSADQLRAIDIAARVSSCLSISGSSFTIISFLSYPPLRKPVNRLAFSIAVANVFACLAYSWGIHPIKAGRDSAWCQTQAFFINWFVMTDPLLVMIMAFNVLLTVRTKRNATELKRVDVYAILAAFVLPFIPALVFLCWRPDGKTVYGPATMWCWIAQESQILRLVAFYVPIWCFILVAIFLFALSGKQILLVRRKVKSAKAECVLHRDEPGPDGNTPQRDRRFSAFARAFMAAAPVTRESGRSNVTTGNSEPEPEPTSPEFKGFEPLAPIHSREVLDLESQNLSHESSIFAAPGSPTVTLDRSGSDQTMLRGPADQFLPRRSSSRFDRIHWKYAKFAFLCTIVLFITWVPISVNRVYNNFISPNNQIYGLYLTSAACIPLHGFGNFVIYTTTSWPECKDFLTCSGRKSSRRSSSVVIIAAATAAAAAVAQTRDGNRRVRCEGRWKPRTVRVGEEK